MKKIFVLNGCAGAGKNSFVAYINKYIPVQHISIIDKIKEFATYFGWNNDKTEKGRKFLSDLKNATDLYNDYNYNYIKEKIIEFNSQTSIYKALFIDIRNPKDIERLSKEFDIKTVFIKNNNVKMITTNIDDANVFSYSYDIIIDNSKTLEDLDLLAKKFANDIIDEA